MPISAGNTRDRRLVITNSAFSCEVYGAGQAGLIFSNGSSAAYDVGRYGGWTNDVVYDYIVEHITTVCGQKVISRVTA